MDEFEIETYDFLLENGFENSDNLSADDFELEEI